MPRRAPTSEVLLLLSPLLALLLGTGESRAHRGIRLQASIPGAGL